ncbi:hypothetical protein MTO96_049368 [Rhipicephalus appendiculatus]
MMEAEEGREMDDEEEAERTEVSEWSSTKEKKALKKRKKFWTHSSDPVLLSVTLIESPQRNQQAQVVQSSSVGARTPWSPKTGQEDDARGGASARNRRKRSRSPFPLLRGPSAPGPAMAGRSPTSPRAEEDALHAAAVASHKSRARAASRGLGTTNVISARAPPYNTNDACRGSGTK